MNINELWAKRNEILSLVDKYPNDDGLKDQLRDIDDEIDATSLAVHEFKGFD